MRNVFDTRDSTALAILRLVLGVVFFMHGAQKMLGMFGGFGWTGTMGFFASLGIPAVFGALAIIAEFVGSIALIVGAFARIAALGIIVDMIVAVLLVHAQFGFFANWGGNQKGEGFEFHLLAIAMALAIAIEGAGSMSVDQALSRK